MNYCGLIKCDIANGVGFRVTLFVSGCSHKCKGCHNKETWDENYGKLFTEDIKQQIFRELEKYYMNGLTITGGDPLYPKNITQITELCKEIKNKYPNKTIWLYTGYLYEEIKDLEILNYIDVLIDGPYIESLRDVSLEWRGSSNQRIIYLKDAKK